MMEGERRKRKLGEEENEEAKIEKFFELIRSTKEVRDRLCNTISSSKEKQDKCCDEEKMKEKGSWKPCFAPEDFIDNNNHQMGIVGSLITPQCFSNPSSSSSSSAPSSSSTKPKQVHSELQPAPSTDDPPPPNEQEIEEKPSDHVDVNLTLSL